MFAPSYFASSYFAPSYFPPGDSVVEPVESEAVIPGTAPENEKKEYKGVNPYNLIQIDEKTQLEKDLESEGLDRLAEELLGVDVVKELKKRDSEQETDEFDDIALILAIIEATS